MEATFVANSIEPRMSTLTMLPVIRIGPRVDAAQEGRKWPLPFTRRVQLMEEVSEHAEF